MDEKKLLNGIVVPFLLTFDMSRFYGGVEELEDIDVFGMHTVNRNTAKGGRIYLSSFYLLVGFGKSLRSSSCEGMFNKTRQSFAAYKDKHAQEEDVLL